MFTIEYAIFIDSSAFKILTCISAENFLTKKGANVSLKKCADIHYLNGSMFIYLLNELYERTSCKQKIGFWSMTELETRTILFLGFLNITPLN